MKIAIVGAHSETKLSAPYGDSWWEIWSCSYRNENELPRVDRWFEIHPKSSIEDDSFKPYREYLKTLRLVYMFENLEEYPGACRYPLADMIEQFGTAFLTGTPAFMLALAITKEPESIGLWGISSSTPEYEFQLPALCHFLLLAKSKGIHVIDPSGVLDSKPVYGFHNLERLPIRR